MDASLPIGFEAAVDVVVAVVDPTMGKRKSSKLAVAQAHFEARLVCVQLQCATLWGSVEEDVDLCSPPRKQG